jgi:hypothetical protein
MADILPLSAPFNVREYHQAILIFKWNNKGLIY